MRVAKGVAQERPPLGTQRYVLRRIAVASPVVEGVLAGEADDAAHTHIPHPPLERPQQAGAQPTPRLTNRKQPQLA